MSAVNPLDRFLQTGGVLHIAADGQMRPHVSEMPSPRLLLPGSFNPVHRGHWQLAEVAEQIVGKPAAFELSVSNVDKPALSRDEIRRRISQFNGQVPVWLTHAPKFVDKAACFPGAIFVVGADTAQRIVSPAYYQGNEATMHAALETIRNLNCRFLVACRVDAQGQYRRLGDLPIPTTSRELFEEIPPERFRWDISSSEIRAKVLEPNARK